MTRIEKGAKGIISSSVVQDDEPKRSRGCCPCRCCSSARQHSEPAGDAEASESSQAARDSGDDARIDDEAQEETEGEVADRKRTGVRDPSA